MSQPISVELNPSKRRFQFRHTAPLFISHTFLLTTNARIAQYGRAIYLKFKFHPYTSQRQVNLFVHSGIYRLISI